MMRVLGRGSCGDGGDRVAGRAAGLVSPWFLLLEVIFVPPVLLGIWDYTEPRHCILRNDPIIWHTRVMPADAGVDRSPTTLGRSRA
jgi:hypothetical protein